MDSKKFRMGEIEIFAYDSGELRWERHCGLGECREGRCFRRGDILFIGPAQSSRPGFLKLEFLDRLGGLPAWTSTRYYTTCLDIYRCRTGKAVSAEELVYREAPLDGESAETRLRSETPAPVSEASAERSPEEADYRLKNYKITKRKNGDLVWYLYAGPDMLKSGICIVLEDILFLCPSRRQPANHSKQKFRSNLWQLPTWDQTTYFCPRFPLHECRRTNNLWITRKEQVGDDGQPQVKPFERKGIKDFAGTGCQARADRGSPLNLFSFLRSPANTLNKLSMSGALLRRVFGRFHSKMKLTLSCMRMIGSQALRLILKLLYRVLLLLLFLFMRLKAQYERWPAKNRSSRRR